jgi:hypothetical protein
VGNNNPEAAAAHLRTEIRGFENFVHEGTLTSLGLWCRRTDSALRWLESNTHKLRRCGIADCESPYFIATPTRKKYCSKYCQNAAEIERSRERVKLAAEAKKLSAISAQGVKKDRLSPEGRERIVRAAKATAERRRLERNKGTRPVEKSYSALIRDTLRWSPRISRLRTSQIAGRVSSSGQLTVLLHFPQARAMVCVARPRHILPFPKSL